MDEFMNPCLRARQATKLVATGARPAVRHALEGAGYFAMDTGDTCFAWCKPSEDDTHALISCNNGLDCDPEASDWVVGRYDERGGFVEINGLSLVAAIDAAAVLPVPVRADGSLVEALYPSVQQAMDDLA